MMETGDTTSRGTEWCRQELLAGKWKKNSQIFNEDFTLLLYLPLCSTVTPAALAVRRSTHSARSRGSQRDVVCLSWRIAPSYMSPNVGWGGGVLRGLSHRVQMCTWSSNKLSRSNSIFNLHMARSQKSYISDVFLTINMNCTCLYIVRSWHVFKYLKAGERKRVRTTL
jgi:hypothetical protein